MYSNVHTSPMDLDIIPPLKKRTFSPLIHFDVLSLGFFPNPRSLTSKTQEEERKKKNGSRPWVVPSENGGFGVSKLLREEKSWGEKFGVAKFRPFGMILLSF